MATDPIGPRRTGPSTPNSPRWTVVGQRPSEPRRISDEAMTTMNPQTPNNSSTRRGGTSCAGAGRSASGASRSGRLLGGQAQRCRPPAQRSARAEPPHFAPQGEAGHLPAHDRLAAAPRPVRLQAGAGQARRPGLPGRVPQGQAVRLHLGRAEAAGDAAHVRAVRRRRRLDVRCDPALPRARRRPVRHPVDEHRPVQPRPGRAARLHRLAAPGPAVDRVVGDLRAGHGERRTCPASSC